MNEEGDQTVAHTNTSLRRKRVIPFFVRLERNFRALKSGDRFIGYVLMILVVIGALGALRVLERSFLVTVPSNGGTLVEGEVGSPRFFNPLLAISDSDNDLSTLTYAGLMGLSGDGTLTPVLASGYTVSPDGKTYTFTLRKDAVFSDGSPVTANDVVYTVQKAQDTALKSPLYADWSGVAVSAVDPETVQFTLSKPYTPFLQLTTLGILPARLWQNISDTQFPFSDLETKPVGAGPFVVTKVARDSSGLIRSVTLKENSKYVLGRPHLNGITMVFYTSQDELSNALHSGAVESAYGVQTPNVLTAPYARVFGIFWNPNENQVFTDATVRKALSVAIDRDAIVKEALGGYAVPINGPVPPGTTVTQTPVPTYANPTQAAANVLESGGWEYNGTTREWENAKTKQKLSEITIRTSNALELKDVASEVRDDYAKLGITTDIELYEPGDLSQNVIRPRSYEALLYGMVTGHDQDLYAFWDSQERNDPGLNIALYANKDVDALLEDARTTSDAKQRNDDLQKIEDTVSADYPAAFIYAPLFTYAIPGNLHGVILPQIATPEDRFATVASWYLKTDTVWPFFAK